jgi:hypothetical protein
MSKDSPNKAAGRTRSGVSPSAAEESLTDALNGLEQILEHRHSAHSLAPRPGADRPGPAPADPQYTIPLLHDVVVPGGDGSPGQFANHDHDVPPATGIEDDEAYRKLAERLANEIEVIVQARVEAAVNGATKDIRDQVRNHLEIMLPEIIEELTAPRRR